MGTSHTVAYGDRASIAVGTASARFKAEDDMLIFNGTADAVRPVQKTDVEMAAV